MTDSRGLAAVARLLGDETRAGMCLALLDGRAWTAGELARAAGVAASTATEHLHLLVGGGLLTEERQGRHRYVRLAGPDAAELVEGLAALAPAAAPAPARTLSASGRRKALAEARTCYDHLAGALGVAITDAMAERGLLDASHGLAVTSAGHSWLAESGITVPAGGRRPLSRACLDFTERRSHLAGAVGAALCRHAFASGWVERVGTTRAVRVTALGRRALAEHLGLAA